MEEKVIIHTAISTIFNDVRNIIENGLRKVYQNANTVTVLTYWQVGRRIVEEEQQGERRAEYGAQIINLLSAELCKTYAKGYSPRDLRAYRQFYLCFNDLEIWYSRVPNLTWTHYRTLLSVTSDDARYWYVQEAAREMWSVPVIWSALLLHIGLGNKLGYMLWCNLRYKLVTNLVTNLVTKSVVQLVNNLVNNLVNKFSN